MCMFLLYKAPKSHKPNDTSILHTTPLTPYTMVADQNPVAVVMIPLPLQGHLNQLLHLSRLIATHKVPVHFVCTTTHGRQVKLRVQGWDPNTISTIHFHDLPIPPFACPPPNPNSTNKFPSHLQPLCEAATNLRGPVASLLHKLSPTARRLVIIHDSLMSSVVQDFVSLPNAESYTFHSVSAFSIALYISEKVGEQIRKLIKPNGITKISLSFEGCFTPEFKQFISVQHEYAKLSSGRIYNTCRIIEQPILELLESEARSANKLLWALGPFNPLESKSGSKLPKKDGGPVDRCLNWLDKQASNSVIFVSFGTTTSFSQQQVNEIATGLEKSEHKFVWVVRDADKGDVFSDNNNNIIRVELPKGYEDRVKDQGLVVREWAPQLDILAHPSIGGFMSHCGWNSCIESMSMGVPIAAWPMHSDQPNNAVLVTEVLKTGVLVKDWCQREEVVVAAAVEKAVRRLMGTNEGAEMRRRAVALGTNVRKYVLDGGVTQTELGKFIAHITR
ncbi:zeatin O-glucosyltransferase-like isoform X2 [Bidens hawaiensis]|uniref:zeatin O-glucosyltransferase-like isoform X2 n=1 Tax=Bidens hawaiensis TaxID=980011 RepID=UPI00404B491A